MLKIFSGFSQKNHNSEYLFFLINGYRYKVEYWTYQHRIFRLLYLHHSSYLPHCQKCIPYSFLV